MSKSSRAAKTSLLAFAFAALLALTASSALAARGHVFDEGLSLGEPCTELVCGPGELSEPSAVAVNEATGASTQSISSAPGRPHSSHPEALRSTSRVRGCSVLDQGNDRVQIFDAVGNFLGEFDGFATPAGVFSYDSAPQVSGIAVDNSVPA